MIANNASPLHQTRYVYNLKVAFFSFLLFISLKVFPQNVFPSSGNVGIGTTTPIVPLQIVGSVNDLINITASGSGRGGIYIQNTNSVAQSTFYTDNNRGNFASYCGILSGCSGNTATLFGLPRADRGFFFSDGASNLGMAMGTLTSQPLVFGTANAERMRINSTGNIGIGTTSPTALLHVYSTAQYPRVYVQTTNTSGAPGFAITDASGAEKWTWQYSIPQGFMSFFLAGSGNQMIISNNGSVGIGTISVNDVNYKLFVETGIRTRKIKVDQGTWPDYVFYPGYKLPPLEQIEKYIHAQGHLSGIPTSEDVQKNGLDLGENQAALLKKIEELTLYVIELKKSQEILEKEIEKLKNEK